MALTAEAIAILEAPVPANEIKIKEIQGNKIRFTTSQFVRRVLKAADQSWGKRVVTTTKSIEVHITVLGVERGATADVVEVKGYGTPFKNAEAQAFKRAAAEFGIAAELWDKESREDSGGEDRPSKSGGSSSGGSGTGTASPAQVKFLGDAFAVPAAIAKKLTGGKEGQASALITALKAAKADDEDYEDNSEMHIKRALKKIGVTAAKPAPAKEEYDDEDED